MASENYYFVMLEFYDVVTHASFKKKDFLIMQVPTLYALCIHLMSYRVQKRGLIHKKNIYLQITSTRQKKLN